MRKRAAAGVAALVIFAGAAACSGGTSGGSNSEPTGQAGSGLSNGGSTGQVGKGFFEVDWIGYLWTTETASTSATTFEDVPGLSGSGRPGALVICLAGGVKATVTMELSGAPADVRVTMEEVRGEEQAFRPGRVRFDPGPSGTSTFSSTFVLRLPPGELHQPNFDVEWRSADGAPVTLSRGVLDVAFTTLPEGVRCA